MLPLSATRLSASRGPLRGSTSIVKETGRSGTTASFTRRQDDGWLMLNVGVGVGVFLAVPPDNAPKIHVFTCTVLVHTRVGGQGG